jgi:hypothetical protein
LLDPGEEGPVNEPSSRAQLERRFSFDGNSPRTQQKLSANAENCSISSEGCRNFLRRRLKDPVELSGNLDSQRESPEVHFARVLKLGASPIPLPVDDYEVSGRHASLRCKRRSRLVLAGPVPPVTTADNPSNGTTTVLQSPLDSLRTCSAIVAATQGRQQFRSDLQGKKDQRFISDLNLRAERRHRIMRGRWNSILVCTVFVAAGSMAQTGTPVKTPGGTVGNIPEFWGKSTIGNSVMTQSEDRIGIGTKNDSVLDPLFVQSINGDGGGIGMVSVVVPGEGDYAWAESNFWLRNENAPTPLAYLWAVGAEGTYSDSGVLANEDMYIYDPRSGIYNIGVDSADNVYLGGTGFRGNLTTLALFAGANGNVGLGTVQPGAKLEVNGGILLTKGSTGGITFPDGTVQTTAFTGMAPVLKGGDYAESVDVTGDRTKYEPGDVLVIDSSASGKFLKSAEPYSTSVSGIYSTKPGTVGRRQLTPMAADEVPMAMMGIVPTNVTAENGAIHPGDLLVTSSTLGYAMKGTDRNRMLGAVIGKALGGLDSGNGVIEVVVTLQ